MVADITVGAPSVNIHAIRGALREKGQPLLDGQQSPFASGNGSYPLDLGYLGLDPCGIGFGALGNPLICR